MKTKGQVFHPHRWGDWLTWDGPPRLRLFLTTNPHLAPPKVWTDYRIIRETRAGWADVLLRYSAQTVVLDRHRQATLHRFLRGSGNGQVLYEDELGPVFGRADRKRPNEETSEEREHGLNVDE